MADAAVTSMLDLVQPERRDRGTLDVTATT